MTAGVGVVCLSDEDVVPNIPEFIVKSLRGNTSTRSSSGFREHLIGRMRNMRHNSAIETRTFCI